MKLYFYMVAYPEGLNGLSLCQANWHLTVTITFAPFEIIYKKYQAAVQIETGQIQ
jgi:hypothetical protein